MKEFRVIINGLATDWQDAAEWAIEDMNQFLEFGNIQFEFR